MRLILHIFRKDALHLWKEIAVTWVLLAWLTQLDCWRYGSLPGSTEGWLNVLLPLAWVYLAGVCVLQDAVPGERQFWLALPARRSVVFGAKALFAVVFIHLPYLVSSAIVLSAHGFNPFVYLPHLFQGQLLVLLVLTLPGWALASLARNAMQFILLAIALAGAAILISGDGQVPFQPGYRQPTDEIRLSLVLIMDTVFSAVVLWIQYRDRLTRLSHAVGLAGVILAGTLYLWLPPVLSARLEALIRPARASGPITIRTLESDRGSDDQTPFGAGVSITIPVEISGMTDQRQGISPLVTFPLLNFEIDAPKEQLRIEAERRNGGTPLRNSKLMASMFQLSNRFELNLLVNRSLYSRVSGSPVTLRGNFVANELGNPVHHEIPTSARTDVPDLGECFTSVAEGNLYQEGGLRVVCESPDKIPRAHVLLADSVTGKHWDEPLGMQTFASYPTLTWLSPLNRSEAYYQLISVDNGWQGNRYRVPRETLQHYRLDASFRPATGTTVVGYELQGIELSKFVKGPH